MILQRFAVRRFIHIFYVHIHTGSALDSRQQQAWCGRELRRTQDFDNNVRVPRCAEVDFLVRGYVADQAGVGEVGGEVEREGAAVEGGGFEGHVWLLLLGGMVWGVRCEFGCYWKKCMFGGVCGVVVYMVGLKGRRFW